MHLDCIIEFKGKGKATAPSRPQSDSLSLNGNVGQKQNYCCHCKADLPSTLYMNIVSTVIQENSYPRFNKQFTKYSLLLFLMFLIRARE